MNYRGNSATGIDLFMGLLLLFLLTGPWWWMPWAEKKFSPQTLERLGRFLILPGLPLFAFAATFGLNPNFWDDRYVDNWNDGSYGFMQSAHYQQMHPAGHGWNELNWLGAPEGPYPINFSNCIIWLLNNPDVLAGVALIGLIVFGLLRYMKTGRPSC